MKRFANYSQQNVSNVHHSIPQWNQRLQAVGRNGKLPVTRAAKFDHPTISINTDHRETTENHSIFPNLH
jgi:hypothetical protein